MSSSSDDHEVGYKRPPRQTRWKKGQSGNPDRRYPKRTLSAVEMIDSLLFSPVNIIENGVPRKVTALEAIILQLLQKELAGNQRARAVRMKFEEIARENADRGVEIEFVESDYTRALAAGRLPGGRTNE
jgi:Family of unknown function (DUF5681)